MHPNLGCIFFVQSLDKKQKNHYLCANFFQKNLHTWLKLQ